MRVMLRSLKRGAIAIAVTLLWAVLAFADVATPIELVGPAPILTESD